MLPRVVIVGGGFGGLSASRALRNTLVSVTLIDKRNYHLFRPMLYQVATGLLSADEISGPLRSIFSHQKNVDVLLDEVTGINSDQRLVHLTRGNLLYDFLILATGIEYNYFGHAEWRQRVFDCRNDASGGGQRARLTHALDAERVERRRRFLMQQFHPRHFGRGD